MKAIKTMLKALRVLLGRKADKKWVEDTYLKKTDTPNVEVPVPDWDINDPDEGGYIKNRIAYKEYRDYGDNYHFMFTNGTLTGMKSDELKDSAVGEYVKKYATETATKRNFTLTNGYYVSNNVKNQTSISYGTLKFNFEESTAVRIDYELYAAYGYPASDNNIAVIGKVGENLSEDANYDVNKITTAIPIPTNQTGKHSGSTTIYVPAGEQTVTFKYIKQNTNSITGTDYFKLRAILPAKTLKELFLKYIHTPLRTALASKDYDYKMIMVVEGQEYDARMTSYYEGQGRDYIISDGTYNGDYSYYGKKYRISYSGGYPNESISITTGADEDPLVMPTGSTTVIFKKLYVKQLATEFAPNGNVKNGTPLGSVVAAGANDGKGQNGLQVGYDATADGENSVAFARGNAGGEQSFAMPGGNASGYNSIAARRGQATGSNSIAIDGATGEFLGTGYSTAAGNFAVAVGDSLKATHDNQYVIGEYNLDEDSAFTYGNGGINKRSNAFMIKKDGSAFFAGDVYANVEKGLSSNAKEGNKLVTNTELGTAVNSKLDAPTTATTGQVIAVKTVDENGKVTEVEAVDMSGGSGGTQTVTWHDWIDKIVSDDGENAFDFSTGNDNTTLEGHKCKGIMVYSPSASSAASDIAGTMIINGKYTYQLPIFARNNSGILYLCVLRRDDGLNVIYRGRDTDIGFSIAQSVSIAKNGSTLGTTGKFYAQCALFEDINGEIQSMDEFIQTLTISTTDVIKSGIRFVVKALW